MFPKAPRIIVRLPCYEHFGIFTSKVRKEAKSRKNSWIRWSGNGVFEDGRENV